MWNMVITMTTIGYGDYYAKSHCGRFIAIVIAFWGTFYVSLFVVALTNMLNFDQPESKAFMLLSRLQYKEMLREEAAGILSAAFKL
jgi:succinate-acetate transporter protein